MTTPRDDPAIALAEGFARQVARWAGQLGDPAAAPLAAAAARAVSLAASEGHVGLALDELAAQLDGSPTVAALHAALQASGVVGAHTAPGSCPLVLDDAGRLYLHRGFDDERRLACRLVRAATAPPLQPGPAALAVLRAGVDGAALAQSVAVALALRQRLVVVSGGPGTGKTTTVARLLAALLADAPDLRIALAAPTGKAAARLAEALQARAGTLPAALRDGLPAAATTIHRLLGWSPAGFRHHAGHPLPVDVLVVDEASMLDLALARRLFEAVPDDARIVLLGDRDQLAAVEAGAVFAELSVDPTLSAACRADLADWLGVAPDAIPSPPPRQPGALRDSVVGFDRAYRFSADSGIGRLAVTINAGRAEALHAVLAAGADDAVRWIDDAGAAPRPATWAAMEAGFAPYAEALRDAAHDPAAVHAAFARFRVLALRREGARGVEALNARLARWLRARLGQPDDGSPWWVGRPVMVRRNDALLRLFNGDIGIALPGADGALAVVFPDGAGGWRAIAPARLPLHETAFAMTVHQSQGSEFDEVLVVLPRGAHRVATREALYTAVTRARQRVALAGGPDAVAAAANTPTRRASGLQARLHEAVAELRAR